MPRVDGPSAAPSKNSRSGREIDACDTVRSITCTTVNYTGCTLQLKYSVAKNIVKKAGVWRAESRWRVKNGFAIGTSQSTM